LSVLTQAAVPAKTRQQQFEERKPTIFRIWQQEQERTV
jgi:hypothetical protein